MPAQGIATYNFVTGTRSTESGTATLIATNPNQYSFSGGVLGNGVTSGTLTVDFSVASVAVDFNVEHGFLTAGIPETYAVDGTIPLVSDGTFFGSAVASSSLACGSGCATDIVGGLSGIANAVGAPSGAGLTYQIQHGSPDQWIHGAAAFSSP